MRQVIFEKPNSVECKQLKLRVPQFSGSGPCPHFSAYLSKICHACVCVYMCACAHTFVKTQAREHQTRGPAACFSIKISLGAFPPSPDCCTKVNVLSQFHRPAIQQDTEWPGVLPCAQCHSGHCVPPPSTPIRLLWDTVSTPSRPHKVPPG